MSKWGVIRDITGETVNVTRNAIDIHDADVHTEQVNEHFHQDVGGARLLSSLATAGDVQLTLVSTSGLTVGNVFELSDGTALETDFPSITANSTVTMTLSLNRPLDNDYSTGGASFQQVNTNMGTSGSSTGPNVFYIKPPSDEIWHITRLMISMTSSGAEPDDGTFGGLAALSNGVVVRENKSAGTFRTLTTWQTNGDLVVDMYDVNCKERAGAAGVWGTRGRWTFTKSKAIVRLDGSSSDKIEILIQDSTTDLSDFQMKAQGHKEST